MTAFETMMMSPSMVVVIIEGEGKERRPKPIWIAAIIAIIIGAVVVVVIASSAVTMFTETLAPLSTAVPAMNLLNHAFVHLRDGAVTKVYSARKRTCRGGSGSESETAHCRYGKKTV
jgi:hypothetical protein